MEILLKDWFLSFSQMLLLRLQKISVRFVQEKRGLVLKLEDHCTTKDPFSIASSEVPSHRVVILLNEMVPVEKAYMGRSFQMSHPASSMMDLVSYQWQLLIEIL